MTLDERLLAYVDGELSGEELKLFEAEIAADPRLKDEVEKHRGLAARLATAYAPVLDEKVPGRLKAAARARTPGAKRGMGLPQWAAMAACLVAGVAAGVAGGRYAWPEQGAVTARDGVLSASGALETALTTQLASQAGPVKVGLSFKTATGRYCRTFESAADRLAGLACREPDGWAIQTTTVVSPKATPAYRTAASATPPAVLAAVDGLIAGVPLDAAAERAARDKGWK
jgi:hypothetical protein